MCIFNYKKTNKLGMVNTTKKPNTPVQILELGICE